MCANLIFSKERTVPVPYETPTYLEQPEYFSNIRN